MVFRTLGTLGNNLVVRPTKWVGEKVSNRIRGPITGLRETFRHGINAIIQPLNIAGTALKNAGELVDGQLEAASNFATLQIRRGVNIAAASALAFGLNTGTEVANHAVDMVSETAQVATSAIGTPIRAITGNHEISAPDAESPFQQEFNSRKHS